MERARDVLTMFVEAGKGFVEDRAMSHGAATAFFTALSLAPLVVLLLSGAALLGADAQQHLFDQAERLLGPRASEGLELVVENARRESGDDGLLATVFGSLTLLLSATAVFAQLQVALNAIWHVDATPRSGLVEWLRKRLLSLGMVLVIGFLLLVSLALDAALRLVLGSGGAGWAAMETAISLLVSVALFAWIFKVMPDVEIGWRDVWIGAGLTAVLFAVGKVAIGKYLGFSAVGSSYGAAGSLVVLLVWVYYSALILFYGAEITQVLVRRRGGVRPSPHAERAGLAGSAGDGT